MKFQESTRDAPVTVIVRLVVLLTLIAFPWRILSHGFLPPDDALRHAAKAVSGKSWGEILVLRPEITVDHNPGWHRILRAVHRVSGWDARKLVELSVAGMFLLAACAPLAWLKRPEQWLAALAAVMLVFPYFSERAVVGRPLFVTMAASLVLLSAWTSPRGSERGKAILSTLLMALSTWVHGSWYLLALLPLAFFLAQRWRTGLLLTGCWVAGTFLGALPTGQPLIFLKQTGMIPIWALGRKAPADSLVGEFQSFNHDYSAVVLVGAFLAWRKFSGRNWGEVWRDPVFWLAVLGWAFGFRVVRFWLDWGIPALALWLARESSELLEKRIPIRSWGRVVMAGVPSALLLLGIASDRNNQWSQYQFQALDAQRPEQAEWLPEPGGILYAVNLSVFYQTFFTNPHGPWRYALGFEPSFMQPDDLAVYEELWSTLNAIRATEPWVRKMKSADRLVLLGGPQPAPAIPGLEWRHAAQNTWVGRLPKSRQ